jgi:phosphatidylglycerophosphate synthase
MEPRNSKEKSALLFIPSAVTSIRLSVFPFLLFSLNNGLTLVTDILFLIAVFSDFADGYVARKLGISSDIGAIFDATVDFLFIGGIFLQFTLTGMYPQWAFLLVVFMFAQFALTSLIFKKIFDPVGKYYGSLLYGAIGLTILFSNQFAINIITTALLMVSVACLVSRIIYLKIK